VLRHVSSTRLRFNANREVTGIRADGLRPKQGEGLSVNWLEYHDGSQQARVHAAFQLMRDHLNIKKSAILALINVGQFRAVAKGAGTAVRVVYAPIPGNGGHSEIRHLPTDDDELLDELADKAVCERISCGPLLEATE
jgi:hypothetical protein